MSDKWRKHCPYCGSPYLKKNGVCAHCQVLTHADPQFPIVRYPRHPDQL